MRSFDMAPLERKALLLLVCGSDAKDIASELHISTSYVYSIVRRLKCRFETKTTAGIVSSALSRGLIPLDSISITNVAGFRR